MKILLIAPLKASDFCRGVMQTLQILGHSVETFDYRAVYQGQTFLNRALARLSGLNRLSLMNNELCGMTKSSRPDFIFVLKGELIFPETLDHLKRQTGAKMASWQLDNPFSVFCSTSYLVNGLSIYDHVFVFDPYYVPALRASGIQRPAYLPVCYNELLSIEESLSPADQEKYGSAITFVGNAPGRSGYQRNVSLNSIADLGLKIWGNHWSDVPFPQVQSRVAGKAFGRDMAKAYKASKLAFNINADQSVEGLNMRSFEAPAYGACLLTNETRVLSSHFIIGQEVIVYRDLSDLRTKALYYLAHDDERRDIAAQGQRRCQRDHTLRHRMEEVLSIIKTT